MLRITDDSDAPFPVVVSCDSGYNLMPFDEAKANARLISAAPDMLAALRAAVASAEGIARRNKQEAPFWTLEAKAAIDKATGV